MQKDILYETREEAAAIAEINSPTTVRVASASDFANLSMQGYSSDGEITFRVYRTFNDKYKQKYQIRYCYTDH